MPDLARLFAEYQQRPLPALEALALLSAASGHGEHVLHCLPRELLNVNLAEVVAPLHGLAGRLSCSSKEVP